MKTRLWGYVVVTNSDYAAKLFLVIVVVDLMEGRRRGISCRMRRLADFQFAPVYCPMSAGLPGCSP